MKSVVQKEVKDEKSLKQKDQMKKYAESLPKPIAKASSLTKTDS